MESKRRQALLQKAKSKPSKEVRTKRRHERSHSPISEERRVSKWRLLKLAEESSSSSVEDDASAIVAQPMTAAAPTNPAPRSSRLRERGIIIKEQPLQRQLEQPEAEASGKNEDPEIRRKGKKLSKKALVEPSSEPTLFPSRKALLKVAQDRLRTKAWQQRKKDKAAGVGGSARGTRSSSASLEVE